jgi:hypothetical protein
MNRTRAKASVNRRRTKTTNGLTIADERASIDLFPFGGETYRNLLFNGGKAYSTSVEHLCALVRTKGESILIARKCVANERATIEAEAAERSPYYRLIHVGRVRWRFGQTQFVTQVQRHWPTATIGDRTASEVRFKIPRDGHVFDCHYDANARTIKIIAPIELSAEVACWLRRLLPDAAQLRLVDHTGTFDVAVNPKTTYSDLIEARGPLARS